MKNNLETAAYLALIVLDALHDAFELNEKEILTTQSLAEQIKNTTLYTYEEDVDVVGLCFKVLVDYIKEEGV